MEAPTAAFRDTTPPLIEAELRRHCSYYMLVGGATWGSLFELGDVSRDSARAIL